MQIKRFIKYTICGLGCTLISFTIAAGSYSIAKMGNVPPSRPCLLSANSDHAMEVLITSPTAQAICSKIVEKSSGLWDDAYGSPYGTLVCSVRIGRAVFSVYDPGLTAKDNLPQLYTTIIVCPILRNDKRLLGQGY